MKNFNEIELRQVDEIVLTAGGLETEEREAYLRKLQNSAPVVDEARRRLRSADSLTDSFLSLPVDESNEFDGSNEFDEPDDDAVGQAMKTTNQLAEPGLNTTSQERPGEAGAGSAEGRSREVPNFPGLDEHWEVLDCVGKGGMARVYKAIDRRLGRPVALKVLTHSNPMMLRRFLREARAQAKIRHANVLAVYDIGEREGQHYIAMHYVEGETLLAHQESTSLDEKLRLILQVADALHAAHQQGLLHRDVKPSNILVEKTTDGLKAWVSDFGIVAPLGGDASMTAGVTAGITATGTLVGTPAYVAPERLWEDGPTVDRRADVYSLGVTMYQFLTGELPFGDDSDLLMMLERIAKEPPRPPQEVLPSLPTPINDIILKCLAKEPADRYPTTRAMAEDLEQFLGKKSDNASGWARSMAANRFFQAAAVFSVLLLAGLGWLSQRGSDPKTAGGEPVPVAAAPVAGEEASEELTTVILVRHAEKQTDVGNDPALTEEGEARARKLAHVLGGLRPEVIYSTPLVRTMETARPLADALGMDIVPTPIETAESYVAATAELIRREHAGDVVVVVGHSNTTPDLIRALGVPTDLQIPDSDYDNLFVVTFSANGPPRFLPLRFGAESE